MNDLEMSKAIARLEGVGVHIDSVSERKMFVRNVTCEEYNPITDLALNCMLSDKYEVTTLHEHYPDGTYIAVAHINDFYRISAFDKKDLPRTRVECILKSKGLYIKSNNIKGE